MSQRFIQYGVTTARSRPGLAGLLYGLNLVVGIVLTIPIFIVLSSVTADTGFAPDLNNQFDITLWTNIMQEAGPVFQALIAQLIWITPVFLFWKVASSVGIIHTLGTDGNRSFWQGVGEYTPRGLLVGLLFLVPLIVFLVGFAIIAGVLSWAFPGEVASFWIRLIILPIFLILGIAFLDQMHDYARMSLVIGHRPVVESFLAGLKFPFQYGMSSSVYTVWFMVGTSIVILPALISQWMGGIWLVFLIQQVVLFCRAGISVGWFASEHALYEAAVAAPAIAENTYAASPENDGSESETA